MRDGRGIDCVKFNGGGWFALEKKWCEGCSSWTRWHERTLRMDGMDVVEAYGRGDRARKEVGWGGRRNTQKTRGYHANAPSHSIHTLSVMKGRGKFEGKSGGREPQQHEKKKTNKRKAGIARYKRVEHPTNIITHHSPNVTTTPSFNFG